MQANAQSLVELENRFWRSMVDNDTETALSLLDEPALMVSSHGAMKFDHAGYRQMAEKGTTVLRSYELKDVDVFYAADDVAILTYKVSQTTSPRGKADKTTETMADSSTWVHKDGHWRCVMHTESAIAR